MVADNNTDVNKEQYLHDEYNVNNPEDLAKLLLIGDEDDEDIEEDSIKIVWLSEITEIRDEEDILQTVATFSRGLKDYFCVLYEYNPPKNKYHMINQWVEEMRGRPDVQITHTDYRTVPEKWLGKIFIQQAEELKKIDEQRYNHIYLGQVTGLDGLIYNYDLIQIIEDLGNEWIVDFDLFIDTGHQTSATNFLCVGTTNKGRLVLLDTYYYSPNGKPVKKAPSEFSSDLWDFLQYCCVEYETTQDKMIIDSAEGGIRNQFFKDYGIRLKPVSKLDKEQMIDKVQDLLATKTLYVINNENNWITLHEHKNYEWKENSVETGKPVPDKREKQLKKHYYNSHSDSISTFFAEHTCDSLQYGTIMNLKKYGMKM